MQHFLVSKERKQRNLFLSYKSSSYRVKFAVCIFQKKKVLIETFHISFESTQNKLEFDIIVTYTAELVKTLWRLQISFQFFVVSTLSPITLHRPSSPSAQPLNRHSLHQLCTLIYSTSLPMNIQLYNCTHVDHNHLDTSLPFILIL